MSSSRSHVHQMNTYRKTTTFVSNAMKIAESAKTVIFATHVMKITIWVSKDIVNI